MPLMDSLVDRTWLRKVSLSLEYDNRLPKLKGKENKGWERKEKGREHLRTMGQPQRV